MGRYSFFSTICFVNITDTGYFRGSVVYAVADSSDSSSSDGDSESVVDNDKLGIVQQKNELKPTEIIPKIEEKETKQEVIPPSRYEYKLDPFSEARTDFSEFEQEYNVSDILTVNPIEKFLDAGPIVLNVQPQFRVASPRKFPSSNWSYNYQVDPNGFSASGSPGFTDLRSKTYWLVRSYNDFLDASVNRIQENSNLIGALAKKLDVDNAFILTEKNNQIAAVHRKVDAVNSALNGRVDDSNAHISSNYTAIMNLAKKVDTVDSYAMGAYNGLGNLAKKVDEVNKYAMGGYNGVANLAKKVDEVDKYASGAYTGVANLAKKVDEVDKYAAGAYTGVANLAKKVDEVDKYANGAYTGLANLAKKVDSESARLDNRINVTDASLALSIANNIKTFSDINKQADNDRIDRAGEDAKLSNRIDELEGKKTDLTMFDVDLTLVDSSKTNGAEGSFVKLIKGQNSLLIKEIKGQFLDFFKLFSIFSVADSTAKENDKDGIFVKLLKNLIYSLRYSVIEEFKELKEFLQLKFLELENAIKSVDLSVTTGLNNVSSWLQLIYNKELIVNIPEIKFPEIEFPEIPKIDYDRLQKMFDGIDFEKNITNKAGKNFWDFMIKLMDTIDKFLSGSFDFIKWLTDLLIDLIIPKDANFFSNRISKLSGKFDKKFKFVLDLKDVFSNTMTSEKVKLPKSFDFTFMGNKIQAPLDMLQMLADKVKLPMTGFMIFEILIFCYKKVTGADSGGVIE